MYKIAFFDVDGTIFDGKSISPKTKRAIRGLQKQGILPVICTGRAKAETSWLLNSLGISYGIFNNGAVICYQDQVIDKSPIPSIYVQELLERANRYGTTLVGCGIDSSYTNRPHCPILQRIRKELNMSVPRPFPSTLPECFQVILFCREEEEYRFRLDDIELAYHRWNRDAYDLNLPGMNKAVGVERLLRYLQIPPEQAIAFGDGVNDYQMLKYVGCGVKMGNGHPILDQVARLTTKSIAEDGVYYALTRILNVINV